MMKKIAVLMTVHNRRDKTLNCLKNLYENEIPQGHDIHVYMTDDGCTDGTPEAVSMHFPNVNIVKGDGNLYWNRGMWTAWNEAAKKDYDYYLWLNDDTTLFPYAIKSLIEESNNHNEASIIVGACISPDHSRMTYGGRDKKGLVILEGKSKEVTIVNGNILLVPQNVFKVLGNLNLRFHHGGGDFDYSWRAGQAGIKCYQASDYLGECDNYHSVPSWCNPKVPLLKRIKALNRPNGMPPSIVLYEERRERGFMTACFHYFTVYLKCFFPVIWIWKEKFIDKY